LATFDIQTTHNNWNNDVGNGDIGNWSLDKIARRDKLAARCQDNYANGNIHEKSASHDSNHHTLPQSRLEWHATNGTMTSDARPLATRQRHEPLAMRQRHEPLETRLTKRSRIIYENGSKREKVQQCLPTTSDVATEISNDI